ncbi:MAG: hypothetical protein IBX56_06020 [Methylomicrobium sp.]|nr:hypothetical protein [Methylomicrobium sp.]
MNKINPQQIADKLRNQMCYSPILGVWHMQYQPKSGAFNIDKWFLKKVRKPDPGEFAPVFPEFVHREIVRALDRVEIDFKIKDIKELEQLLRLYLLPDERLRTGIRPTNHTPKRKI